MATRAEVRTTFKDLLNNTLCTDALADHFIELAARRVSRLIKTKDLEKTYSLTVVDPYAGYISKPADYRSLIEIRVDVGTSEYRLIRKSSDEALAYKSWAGSQPCVYFREENKFYIYPVPRVGDVVKFRYHMELAIPATEGGSDVITTELRDLIIYTALVFAADHFVDDRKGVWEKTATDLATEIDGEARNDELSGQDIRVSNPYEGGY